MPPEPTSRIDPQRLKVLCAGVFSLILAMGVARFAYTPLLPLMQAQAGLGLAEGGWLAAANYIGYLLGALIASLVSNLVLKDRLYRLGMLLAVASTAMMGLLHDPIGWALSRFIAGLGTAAGLMLGSGLILNWLIHHGHRSELGIHFSGVGLGMAVSAAAVLLMSPALDWQAQWLCFSLLGAVLLIPALGWLPRPDQRGEPACIHAMRDRPPSPQFLRVLMAAYFCAGVGYVVTATFIVAIVEQTPRLAGQGTWIFLLMGLAAGPSCMLWDLIARRIGERDALLLAAVLEVIGILLPAIDTGWASAAGGALLFGGTHMGIVSLVLTMAGRYYPTRPARMMGRMTIAYSVGQIIGPAMSGWLAERQGGYAGGLVMAAGVMTLGTVLLYFLRSLREV